jgi:hypothetical protein
MTILGRPPRFELSAPLQFAWDSMTIQALVRDFSHNGRFIETTCSLELGATFLANLMLNPSIPIYCSVCRIDPGFGMAVRVAFATREDNDLYAMLVEKLGIAGEANRIVN